MDIKELRVQALRRLIGQSQLKDFAEAHDLDASYLSQILNGHRGMGEKAAAKMADKIGVGRRLLVSPDQYIEGAHPRLDGTAKAETPRPQPSAELIGPISPWDDDTPLDDDEVALPLLKGVMVAAGSGRIADEFDSGKKIRMGKFTLRNQGVQFDQAVCVTVTGNSMEPALPDGSTVGVNLGNTTVKDGKVYVVRHDGELRVKQLYRLTGGGIRLRSFNRAEHEDEDYSPEQMAAKEISVVGRVFWSSVLWD